MLDHDSSLKNYLTQLPSAKKRYLDGLIEYQITGELVVMGSMSFPLVEDLQEYFA